MSPAVREGPCSPRVVQLLSLQSGHQFLLFHNQVVAVAVIVIFQRQLNLLEFSEEAGGLTKGSQTLRGATRPYYGTYMLEQPMSAMLFVSTASVEVVPHSRLRKTRC